MKIAIGYKLQNGPWGGGNAFAKSFVVSVFPVPAGPSGAPPNFR